MSKNTISVNGGALPEASAGLDQQNAKRSKALLALRTARREARDEISRLIKSMVAAIYEDGHLKYLRRAMHDGQFISWSVALDFASRNIHRTVA